jgi:hypothetical protein
MDAGFSNIRLLTRAAPFALANFAAQANCVGKAQFYGVVIRTFYPFVSFVAAFKRPLVFLCPEL